jgi:hypothetical protein
MTRASLGIWTGAGLALLLAGCSMNDLVSGLVGVQAGPGGDRVVYASLETVSRNTEGSLRELGLVVRRTDDAGVVRFACTNRAGGHFTVVLTKEQNYQGERVRVRLDWQDGRDEQAGLQVLAHVEKQAAR